MKEDITHISTLKRHEIRLETRIAIRKRGALGLFARHLLPRLADLSPGLSLLLHLDQHLVRVAGGRERRGDGNGFPDLVGGRPLAECAFLGDLGLHCRLAFLAWLLGFGGSHPGGSDAVLGLSRELTALFLQFLTQGTPRVVIGTLPRADIDFRVSTRGTELFPLFISLF